MKNLFLFLSLVSIVFSSCSSEDEVPAIQEEQLTTNGYLIKKSIWTNFASGEVKTTDYFYNGIKITKLEISNGQRIEYTYTGDLITKQFLYINNVLKEEDHYQYDAQQRITQKLTFLQNPDSVTRTEYTYNSDQTVSIKRFQGDTVAQNNLLNDRKAFLLPNGDINKLETYLTQNGNAVTKTYQCYYDSNNTQNNSVVGLNKIKYWELGSIIFYNQHNVTSIVNTTTENSSVSTENQVLTYNSYGCPVTANYSVDNTGVFSIQYFYQQP